MNLVHEFQVLGHKQNTIQQGTNDLRKIQNELSGTMALASSWGLTAIIANAALIPLNAIINSFELKRANSLYQTAVRALYGRFSKSGTRINNKYSKEVLKTLKDIIIQELTRKGMTDFVPGVNIIGGLAQDSIALLETAQTVESGSKEMKNLMSNINLKIEAARLELFRIGNRRSEILDYMKKVSTTA